VVNGPGPDVSDPVEALKLIKSGKPFRYSGAYGDFKFTSNGDPQNLTYGHHVVRDGVNTLIGTLK
jgi:branched-chain amino acid transport system substrate-binding protein